MTRSPRTLALMAILGALAAPAAQAMTVGRCNLKIDGVFTPVLIVADGTGKTVHQIGTDGLTRSIAFDPAKAQEWAALLYGVGKVSYSDRCHAVQGKEAQSPAAPVADPAPPEEPAEDPVDPPEDDPEGPVQA